ncbi:MAG: glycoside hydrolase family 3 C-terminal domain-containing protein, partial [Oscillospiraceae bacterium]|nr:glycoside hydrolase family 3 C-terminal domain-containing protein [Oscillospiraceae bacterium]
MQLLTKARYDSGENERERRNRQLALEAACEGMVLLKNNGVLPFAVGKVALYGAGAIYTVKGGTGSGEVNERRSVNILQGLEDRGFTVTTKRWLQDYEAGFAAAKAAYEEEKKKRVSIFKLSSIMQMLFDNFRAPAGRAITEADVADSGTDCCIYVLSRQAGEGGDRRAEAGDWLLTEQEREHLRFCAAHYCRVLLCVNCGGMVDLAFAKEDDGIGAVLLMGQAGTEGGHALADVISGAASPCGKLADSWPARYEDVPFGERFSYLGGSKTETYSEGIYVGYRYYDSFGVQPLWHFGYGMSYTDFSLRMCDMQLCGSELVLTAEVKNTGAAAGKEAAQLYVSAPAGRLHKEHQRLAAFGKTKLLQTGQSEQLQLRAELENLASFDEEKGAFVLEAGEYILRLGTSSRHTQAVGVLTLPQEIAVSRHTAVCLPEEPITELCAAARQQEALPQGLPRIAVEPAVFSADCCRHSGKEQRFDEKTEQLLQTLSVKEMAELVVGAGMFGAKTRFTLPGAVGNTTSRLWDRGIANIALCDGPAGLRVQKRSTKEKNGSVKPVDMAMS